MLAREPLGYPFIIKHLGNNCTLEYDGLKLIL